jgi:hypothetical protein
MFHKYCNVDGQSIARQRRMITMLSLCLCNALPLNFEFLNQSLWNLAYAYHGTWAHLNSTINTFHPSVCVYVYVYDPVAASHRLGKNVIAATNTHATIEELMDALLSMQSVSCEWKVGDYLIANHLIIYFHIWQSLPPGWNIIGLLCRFGCFNHFIVKVDTIKYEASWRSTGPLKLISFVIKCRTA